jgi:CRP-like cAMP-binding protein
MTDETIHIPSTPGESPVHPRLTTLGKAEIIRALGLFSQASVEQLYRLASIAQEADFAPGQTIFQEEDIGDAFYVLVEGKVEHTSEKRNIKEILGPGDTVGLYSVLTREPRYATARALEDTFAISIGAEDLYNLLSNNMEIVVSVFKYFITKLGMGPAKP